jgi:hypothetical protein
MFLLKFSFRWIFRIVSIKQNYWVEFQEQLVYQHWRHRTRKISISIMQHWKERQSCESQLNQNQFTQFGSWNFILKSNLLVMSSSPIWVIPAEINTPSGRPYQILLIICGFESTIPRITFGVLTRSDTLACSEESPCGVGRIGHFFRIFIRLSPTFNIITFDRVDRFGRNMDCFKGE